MKPQHLKAVYSWYKYKCAFASGCELSMHKPGIPEDLALIIIKTVLSRHFLELCLLYVTQKLTTELSAF